MELLEKTPREPGSERAILFFTCAGHALTHMYMLLFTAAMYPMMESFRLDDEGTFTSYATISVLLFGVGALPAGWLGDRLGEKRMLVAFFLLSAVGGTVVGAARGLAGLAAGMAILGIGTSIFHPVGNAMIAKGIRQPGKAMGVNGLWGSLGTAAGPIFAGQIAHLLGWQWAYLLLAPPTLLLGVWLAVTRIRMPNPVEREAPEEDGSSTTGERPGGHVGLLAFLIVAMTCGGLYYHLITTMLPTHLAASTESEAMSGLLRGGYLAGLIYTIGGVGQLLAGRLVHHREGRGLYVLMLVAAVPLVFLTGKFSGLSLVFTGSLMAVFLFAVQPIENTLLSRYSRPSHRGLLFGLKFVLAFGVGGGLGTRLSGAVVNHYETPAVFTVAAGITILAFLFALAAYLLRR